MVASASQTQAVQSNQADPVSSLTDEHKAALKLIGIGSDDNFTQVENFIAAIGIGNTEDDQEKVSALFRGIAGDIYSRMDEIKAATKSNGGLTAAEFFGDGVSDFKWFNSLAANIDNVDAVDENALPANFTSSLTAIAQQVNIPDSTTVPEVITLLRGMFSGTNFDLAQDLATSIADQYTKAEEAGSMAQVGFGLTLKEQVEEMGGKVPNTQLDADTFGDDWQQLTNMADVLANGISDGLFGLHGKGDEECNGLEANESCKLFVESPDHGWVLNMPALMRTRNGTDDDGNEVAKNLLKEVFDKLRDDGPAKRTCMDADENKKDKCEANDYFNQVVKDLDEANFGDYGDNNQSVLGKNDNEVTTSEFLAVMKAGDAEIGLSNAEWEYLLKGDNDGLSEIFAKYYGSGNLADQREEFVNDLFVVALPWKMTDKIYKDQFDTIMKDAKNIDEAADEVTKACC